MCAIFIVFLLLLLPLNLHGVLDGRIAPIYLSDRYTFTNFEWARGNVYFEQGFDAPINGTVILNINQEVGGTIGLRNSTLRLNGNLNLSTASTITGSGFIDAQDKTIFFKRDWKLQANETFIITSAVTFEGLGRNQLNLQGAYLTGGISVNQGVSNITFRRFTFGSMYGNNFTTKSNAPSGLRFIDSDIILVDSTVTFNSGSVLLSGNINLLGAKTTLIMGGIVRFEFFTTLYVGSQITLRVGALWASNPTCKLILENARLDYRTTLSSALFFRADFSTGRHLGTLLIKGRSQIITQPGKELFFTRDSILEIDTGALLTINAGTKFTVG